MKHNFIRKVLSVMLSCSIMVLGSVNVSSEENVTSDSINIYVQKFELLNEKYGTNFVIAIPDMTESEINDLFEFYSEMTDEEFEEYFLGLKKERDAFMQMQSEIHGVISSKEKLSRDNKLPVKEGQVSCSREISSRDNKLPEKDEITSLNSPTITETQYYYYNPSNDNNLSITASVNYSAGWGQYVSVDKFNYEVYHFPAYVIQPGGTYSINSYYGKCDAVCNIPCYLYYAEYVHDNTLTNINVTFTAGGGDIRAI